VTAAEREEPVVETTVVPEPSCPEKVAPDCRPCARRGAEAEQDALAELIRTDDVETAMAIAEALARNSGCTVRPSELIAAMRRSIDRAGWEQVDRDPFIDALGEALHHRCKTVRLYALDLLQRANRQRAAIRAERALRDLDPEVRQRAAEVLGAISDAVAFRGLERAVSDCDPAVQRAAVKALVRIGDRRALDTFVQTLDKSGDSELRGVLVFALQRMTGQTQLGEDSRAWRRYLRARPPQ
jgi:HEAT repeat protein